MGDDKIQELFLQLVQDMSFVKAKLSYIEEQKFSARIDTLEAQNREHDRTIKSLEKRNDTMEEFVRGALQENKKQQTGVFISLGMAVFSAIISVLFGLLIRQGVVSCKWIIVKPTQKFTTAINTRMKKSSRQWKRSCKNVKN